VQRHHHCHLPINGREWVLNPHANGFDKQSKVFSLKKKRRKKNKKKGGKKRLGAHNANGFD
jgi:hypothetical protein